MDALGKNFEQDKDLAQIPDLDWMVLSKENIPSEFPVESIPQLQEAWTHTNEASTRLVSNSVVKGGLSMKKASQEDINGVINQAKKEMMLGYTGKGLADRLASMYMPDFISAAKDELIKLASEQGLLGKVYIDLSPFDSCHEAAKMLGKNRIRTARYVIGNPRRSVCSSHKNGFCKELNKRVREAMDYSGPILSEYTTHLRVAGVIGNSEIISSKENLREAFLRQPVKASVDVAKEASPIDVKKVQRDFSAELEKSAAVKEKQATEQRFFEARPILAFMQNQLLKGKVGDSLKESILHKYSSEEISKYSSEIAKVASLQGLLGNIYVDVSYYKTPDEAVQAIRTASTNPIYLVQSYKPNEFDTTIAKVANATGCSELPRDGKLDKKVMFSYISDLQGSNRISSSVSRDLLDRVVSGDTSLNIVKEAFDASLTHKKEVRTGGVKAAVAVMTNKKASDTKVIRDNIFKALEAGVAVDRIEDKVATLIGTTEAVGLTRNVLADMSVISADSLSKCTSQRYELNRQASIKPTAKCADCVFKGATSCVKQSADFEGQRDLSRAFFDIKEAGEKKDESSKNPDTKREDMNQKYEISDDSGMNIALDKMKSASTNFEIEMNGSGFDSHLE